MHQVLKSLGYEVRMNVPLAAFDDLEEKASLVAYDGEEPIVVCFPVSHGADDAAIREAARFQAHALDPKRPARFIWVGDETGDYFLDIGKDEAVSSLPARDSIVKQG
jgi:hypothetical protein